MITALALALVTQVKAPKGQLHPEWGPEPPVAPHGKAPLPHEHCVVSMIFPLIGPTRWGDDFGTNRGSFWHTGLDMKAVKMTPIVAPIDGYIGLKKFSFWIWNPKGYAILGTHLNHDTPGTHDHACNFDYMFAPNLKPGQYVAQGQFIGYVGMSGDATAPHLHFELYAGGKGTTMSRIRNPIPSLDQSQRLSSPKPYAGMSTDRPSNGMTRLDGCFRKFDPQTNTLTMILVARVPAEGPVQIITHPEYRRIKLNDEQAEAFRSGSKLDCHDVIELFVSPSQDSGDLEASKVVLPRKYRERKATVVTMHATR